MDLQEDEIETSLTETEYNKRTKLPVRQTTRLNGFRQTPPDDSAAVIEFDDKGRPTKFVWIETDSDGNEYEHRQNGPSTLVVNPDNGIHVLEEYFVKGQPRPASEGPYSVHRHFETNEVLESQYGDDPDHPNFGL